MEILALFLNLVLKAIYIIGIGIFASFFNYFFAG